MKNERKETAVRKLTETREEFFQLARRIEESEWTHPIYTHGEEWSAADVLRHVTDAEKGMLATMRDILAGGGGAPEDFDIDRWNRSRVARAKEKTPAELLAQMEENRAELLAFIEELDPEDLDEEGRHASLQIMSIEEILHRIADHERQHMADLRQALEG
ncbi:MAG: DinB family protein [Candidatus Promineifilaceae bacterium]|nr:DinB family protein [Candidatus Promineifilaceae bacterium]